MLVLSRRKAERIQIGDNIEILVIEVRSGRVKLGIRAPQEIRVLRSEIAMTQAVGVVHDTTSEADMEMPAVPVLPRRPR